MSQVLRQNPDRIWPSDTGLSRESGRIRQVFEWTKSHRNEPVSVGWKKELYDLAMEIGEECSESGWDGYNAAPITRDAVIRTLRLIYELSEMIQPPNLVPSPGGYISFEWHDPDRHVVSVSPKAEVIVWAAVLAEDDSQYGKSPIRKGWPSGVLNILYESFSRSRSISTR
jgi:hypothetical protein